MPLVIRGIGPSLRGASLNDKTPNFVILAEGVADKALVDVFGFDAHKTFYRWIGQVNGAPVGKKVLVEMNCVGIVPGPGSLGVVAVRTSAGPGDIIDVTVTIENPDGESDTSEDEPVLIDP